MFFGDWTLVAVRGFHPLSCPLSRRGREEREGGEGRDWLETSDWRGFPACGDW